MAQKFVYMAGGQEVVHEDPGDAYTPQQIKAHWAVTFPELSDATWGEKEVDGVKVITFAKKVGTKGADAPALEVWACWQNGSGGETSQVYRKYIGPVKDDTEAQRLFDDWRVENPACDGWKSQAWYETSEAGQ